MQQTRARASERLGGQRTLEHFDGPDQLSREQMHLGEVEGDLPARRRISDVQERRSQPLRRRLGERPP